MVEEQSRLCPRVCNAVAAGADFFETVVTGVKSLSLLDAEAKKLPGGIHLQPDHQ